MTTKHSSPEWHRTTRHVRTVTNAAHKRGEEPVCWRCGRPLPESDAGNLIYDVGHLDPNGGEGLDNAAPEHRSRTGACVGNRAHGGRMGAALTNSKRSTSTFRAPAWA